MSNLKAGIFDVSTQHRHDTSVIIINRCTVILLYIIYQFWSYLFRLVGPASAAIRAACDKSWRSSPRRSYQWNVCATRFWNITPNNLYMVYLTTWHAAHRTPLLFPTIATPFRNGNFHWFCSDVHFFMFKKVATNYFVLWILQVIYESSVLNHHQIEMSTVIIWFITFSRSWTTARIALCKSSPKCAFWTTTGSWEK